MITYEQDPDVVRWGLQLFDSDPYSNCGYLIQQHNDNDDEDEDEDVLDYNQVQFFKEGNIDSDLDSSNNVENDEVIAHALQEELSQLAMLEDETQSSQQQGLEGNLQVETAFLLDWPESGRSVGNYGSGKACGVEDNEPSCPEEFSFCEDEWLYSLGLTDEYAFDGEVGKRLNQMVPIPHVPRINGEIPSIDEATLDHQRLLDRLQLWKWVECKVPGDGNCQFRALSDQFYRTPEHHKFVRQQVVNQLKSHPEIYEGYVPMAYDDYLEKMSKNGEWGDHVTLQAAADSYGVKIFVMTSFKETCYIEILPNDEKSRKVICLSFWAEVHYNSVYPKGDLPTYETTTKKKKKKKRWIVQENNLESVDELQ